MDFITPIIALIEQGWDIIKFGVIVNEYEGTIIMRWGKFKRECKPGWNWKWPFAEEVLSCHISIETFSTRPQCVITKDGVSVLVEGAIKGNVDDPKIHLIKVRDVENAISDIAQGIIKQEVSLRTFEECRMNATDKEITKELRKEAKKFGVKVESVILTSVDKVRTYRLINQ